MPKHCSTHSARLFLNLCTVLVMMFSMSFGGVQKAAAEEPVPNPTITVNIDQYTVEGKGWQLGATVQVTFDDLSTSQNPDFQNNVEVSRDVWNSDDTYFWVELENTEPQPGDVVTVTDGLITKQHIIQNLVLTDANIDTDVVQGTADPGQLVNIMHGLNWLPRVYREETVGSDGSWSTNFSVQGDKDWETVDDLRNGTYISSFIRDEDGDSTAFGWNAIWAGFILNLDANLIAFRGWPDLSPITITIVDLDSGQSIWEQTMTQDENYQWPDLQIGVDLKPGDLVRVSNSILTKELFVTDMKATLVDPQTGHVEGVAPSNTIIRLNVSGNNFVKPLSQNVYTDSTGHWSVELGELSGALPWDWTTIGSLISMDYDNDWTLSNWNVDWVAPPSVPAVFAISSGVDISIPVGSVENISVLNTLNDGLFRLDKNNILQTLAATDYGVSSDGLTYTVHLRPGALWSDGQPVTAQHFVDGILRVLDPNGGSDYGFILFPIQNAKEFNEGSISDPTLVGVQATDSWTLVFTLKEPTAHFKYILASPVILPARLDVINMYGTDWTQPVHYVGNGPYRLVEYDQGHILVEKNQEYNGPIPGSFSQIGFDVIPDPAEQIAAYKNGIVDVLLSTPIQTVMDDPVLARDLTVLPSPGVSYIGLSSQVFPTNDPLVRKALASAIDRTDLIQNVLKTSWRVEATGVIPPELLGYQGSEVGYSYDPEQARQFLKVAGYENGVGFPVLRLIAVENNRAVLEKIVNDWETELGITVQVDYVSGGERGGIMAACRDNPSTCTYNGYLMGWMIDYPDAYNLLNDLFNPDSPYNYTQWDSAAYRQLLAQAVSELDPAQRLLYLQQAQELLVTEAAAVIPLVHLDGAMVIRPGIYPYYSPAYFTNLAYWSNVDPAGDGMTAEVVGPSGGTFATENNTVSIQVPAGALTEEISLSVTDLGGNYQIAESQVQYSVLNRYTVQPHGTQFSVPVTLTFAWSDTNNDDLVDNTGQAEAGIRLFKDGVPITPACDVYFGCDMSANILSVQISSLSRFELVVPLNTAPQIAQITAPASPVQIGQTITATVTFNDPDSGDSHAALWDWGDGTTTTLPATPVTASASHNYASPGVYTVTATITDAAGESDTESFQYVVIYDPNGGFVTGGGWITSPVGAYTPNPTLTGKATFGFVSKYQKGANVPTGNTEFQFHVAGMNFKSTSYDWLVIAGTKAQYKGTGTINGAGEYKFMLTAIDGSPDKFRIKIWDKLNGNVIYDNQLNAPDIADPATVIQGGSIVIHKAK